MTFEIRIKDRALKFISNLQKDEKDRLKEISLVLKDDPVPFKSLDAAKMKNEKIILVHRVGFRGDVY